MYQIQIQYEWTGEFENTVYEPLEYQRAQALLNQIYRSNGGTHNYRIVEVPQLDTPLFEEVFGG